LDGRERGNNAMKRDGRGSFFLFGARAEKGNIFLAGENPPFSAKMGYSKPDQVLRRSEARLADRKKEKIRRTISGSWMMASKAAAKAVEVVKSGRPKVKAMTLAERMVWEKYNKPNRNLYQALGAFENNGVGQRVVRLQFLLHSLLSLSNLTSNQLSGKRKATRIAITR